MNFVGGGPNFTTGAQNNIILGRWLLKIWGAKIFMTPLQLHKKSPGKDCQGAGSNNFADCKPKHFSRYDMKSTYFWKIAMD